MNSHDTDSGLGFTTGMIAGAAVGAGLALLFAPRAGAELRSGLGESMGSLRDAVTRHLREMADRAGVQLDNISAGVERATDALESSAREIVESAQRGSQGVYAGAREAVNAGTRA
jgi:gas vesicle protein